MSQKARFFKIGIFTFAAIGILVFAIVIFGAGAMFKEVILLETYFNESVQGLDIGSPVKFRGVSVGQVKSGLVATKSLPR